MFAYVRLCSLYWRKMFEASDGERSSILQNARQTEMGTRETRPSEYRRQRLALMKLDLGRARCLRANAKRMKGKAKGLNDRNTCFIYDTDARGSGLEENLRLSSLRFAYLRLMGEKCLRHAACFSAGIWAGNAGSVSSPPARISWKRKGVKP
jgi:hypothetical protein